MQRELLDALNSILCRISITPFRTC